MKQGRSQTVLMLLILAAACVVWMWPVVTHVNSVAFWPGSDFTDLLISHYPNAVTVNTSLREYHQLPLWNPTILSGTPANADPLVGLWYPARWLTFLLPSIWVFNLLVWGHLVLAGLGAYRLARFEGASGMSAWIAGMIMTGLPKLMAHLALGHIDLIFAICWTPWALVALKATFLRIATKESALVAAMGLGLVGGLVFLADPRWLFPVVLLLIFYAAASLWQLRMEARLDGNILKRLAASAAVASLTAGMAAAPLALPLIQYASLSTRRLLSPGGPELYALPLERIMGLALPLGDVPEFVGYLGLGSLLLFGAGVVLRSRPGRRWGMVAVLFILLAVGSATPLYDLLAGLPGLELLRVPARYLALVGLAASLGGAHALDALILQVQPTHLLRRLNLISVGVAAGAIGLGIFIFSGQHLDWGNLLQVGLSGAGALILILGQKRLAGFKRLYPALWLALIVADLLWMSSKIIEVRPVNWETTPAWLEAIESEDWGQRRVFSPSYALSQDIAARNQFELADGVHPLQLSAYFNYAAEATGFDPGQYSVTLPPFPEGDPSQPWDVNLDGQQLGKLNVEYILSEYPIFDPELPLIADQDGYVYENLSYRPRAWVEIGVDSLPWLPVDQLSWSPNRIVIEAAGPGQLVLSEVDYPGWAATLDGEPIESVLYDGLLRSVQLDEGSHEIEWVYQPTLTWIGLGSWGLLILSLAVIRLKWWT